MHISCVITPICNEGGRLDSFWFSKWALRSKRLITKCLKLKELVKMSKNWHELPNIDRRDRPVPCGHFIHWIYTALHCTAVYTTALPNSTAEAVMSKPKKNRSRLFDTKAENPLYISTHWTFQANTNFWSWQRKWASVSKQRRHKRISGSARNDDGTRGAAKTSPHVSKGCYNYISSALQPQHCDCIV